MSLEIFTVQQDSRNRIGLGDACGEIIWFDITPASVVAYIFEVNSIQGIHLQVPQSPKFDFSEILQYVSLSNHAKTKMGLSFNAEVGLRAAIKDEISTNQRYLRLDTLCKIIFSGKGRLWEKLQRDVVALLDGHMKELSIQNGPDLSPTKQAALILKARLNRKRMVPRVSPRRPKHFQIQLNMLKNNYSGGMKMKMIYFSYTDTFDQFIISLRYATQLCRKDPINGDKEYNGFTLRDGPWVCRTLEYVDKKLERKCGQPLEVRNMADFSKLLEMARKCGGQLWIMHAVQVVEITEILQMNEEYHKERAESDKEALALLDVDGRPFFTHAGI